MKYLFLFVHLQQSELYTGVILINSLFCFYLKA